MDKIIQWADRIQARYGFQWPCWLLDWAWDRQATPHPDDRGYWRGRLSRKVAGS